MWLNSTPHEFTAQRRIGLQLLVVNPATTAASPRSFVRRIYVVWQWTKPNRSEKLVSGKEMHNSIETDHPDKAYRKRFVKSTYRTVCDAGKTSRQVVRWNHNADINPQLMRWSTGLGGGILIEIEFLSIINDYWRQSKRWDLSVQRDCCRMLWGAINFGICCRAASDRPAVISVSTWVGIRSLWVYWLLSQPDIETIISKWLQAVPYTVFPKPSRMLNQLSAGMNSLIKFSRQFRWMPLSLKLTLTPVLRFTQILC